MRALSVYGESGCVGCDVEGESVLFDIDAGDVREYVEGIVGGGIGRSFFFLFFLSFFILSFWLVSVCFPGLNTTIFGLLGGKIIFVV